MKKALTRMNNIELSPVFRWLCHYDQPPTTVAEMIDQDLKASGETHSAGSMQISPSWLLKKRLFHLDVAHLNEIVWIYQKVTQHSYNLIPIGKSHQIVVSDTWGRQIEVNLGGGKKAKENATSLSAGDRHTDSLGDCRV